jgi:hypothetical protein
VFLSNQLCPVLTNCFDFDHSSNVEVSQTNKRNENREDELEDVPEPDDVMRVQAKLGCFNLVMGYIGLQMVMLV